MDQATTLRKIVTSDLDSAGQEKKPAGRMRVIAITSGKGGVGKTNIVLNLCIGLSALGRRVFLLDADMGLAKMRGKEDTDPAPAVVRQTPSARPVEVATDSNLTQEVK